MTLVKFGGAKISEGFSIRQAADDTDLVAVMCGGETGVKVRESCDLLDEGKSAAKDAEAQQLVIPIQHS